jgi:hypothetical protein
MYLYICDQYRHIHVPSCQQMCRSVQVFLFLFKLEQFSWISLKSGGTKDHFRQVKLPGTVSYWKVCSYQNKSLGMNIFTGRTIYSLGGEQIFRYINVNTLLFYELNWLFALMTKTDKI